MRMDNDILNKLDETEDDYDLKAYESAMSKYKADPVTYTLDEIESELGIKYNVDL